jgi:arylsulfatase A-like enzyme
MGKRALFFIICSIILGSITACKKASDNPNIILFLADDMGYGDPSCYDPESKIPTPNIDRLAGEGVRFVDAHSPASVCSPTRYAILTGRYAWRGRLKKGVLGPYNLPLIEEGRLTLPQMLKEKGYQTACIGKWHLGMKWATIDDVGLPESWVDFDQSIIDHRSPITAGPLTAGFDYYFGTDVPNFPPYLFIENDHEIGYPSIDKPDTIFGNPGKMLPGWKLEEILPGLTKKAVEYINSHARARNDKPFFLYFASTAPHTPIVPASQFQGKSSAGPYGDLVYQVDNSLVEIMKALEKNGLEGNTLIFFTSDNGSPARAGDPHVYGEAFHPTGSVIRMFKHNPNSPWRGMKADIWEGGHRVPFIAKWPGRIPENKVLNEPLISLDIMATVAEILDYELPENAAEDSWDMSGLMLQADGEIVGDTGNIREAMIHHSGNGKFAIRQGKWKYIPQLGSGGWTEPRSVNSTDSLVKGQLYDMDADPGETNNLWLQYPEVAARLQELLNKYQQTGRSAPERH